MCKIMLTEQEHKELKSYCWEKNFDDTFSIGGISIEKFSEFTGYDLARLNELKGQEKSMGWNLVYGRPGTCDTCPTSYYLHWVVYIDNKIWLNGSYFIADVDFLELYTKEEEPTEEKSDNPIEKLRQALKDCRNDVSIDTADITSCIEEFDYIYDSIKTNVLDNIGVNDLPGYVCEDAAKEWIENNPDDAWDMAENNLCSGDIRDKIINYLENKL